MSYQPSQLIRSMVLFSWDQTTYLVSEWINSLRLGLTGCKPFLPRPERARLAAALARFEPLVRRLLFLMALEKGALATRLMAAPASRTPPETPSTRAALRYLRTPRFRIAEPPARPGHGKPPSRAAANRPRIRFLDMPLPPPGPFDYPPRDTDLLPARPLIQRLRALHDVWDNPAYYITAMRRRIGRANAAPVIRHQLPPAFRARNLSKAERETAKGVHAEAAGLVPQFNSS